MSSLDVLPDQIMISTDMPLLWVQYWTALPIVVEDRDMSDAGNVGGRLPSGPCSIDPSTQFRPGEGDSPPPSSMSIHEILLRLAMGD